MTTITYDPRIDLHRLLLAAYGARPFVLGFVRCRFATEAAP